MGTPVQTGGTDEARLPTLHRKSLGITDMARERIQDRRPLPSRLSRRGAGYVSLRGQVEEDERDIPAQKTD